MADILPLQFLPRKKLPCSRSSQIPFSLNPMSFLGAILLVRKALPRFFLCIFQLPYLPEETCFQQAGSSAVEGISKK
jgi:hypothetical protein